MPTTGTRLERFGLVSGTTGGCPLYLPFGFSTAGRDDPNPELIK